MVHPTRDCEHPGKPHQHGTPIAYRWDRCRCDPCRTARARQAKRSRVHVARGHHTDLQDATPVREHIATLLNAGLPTSTITREAGVSRTQVLRIRTGRTARTSKRVADAIQAIPEPRAPRLTAHLIDVTGTRRRLQALTAIGYDGTTLARALGMDLIGVRRTTNPTMYRAYQWTTEDTHHKVTHLYDRLWDQPPQPRSADHRRIINRTRRSAAQRGWQPPAAWDDDRIDDPTYRPEDTRRTG